MAHSIPKRLKKLAKELQRQGWEYKPTKSHPRWCPPPGWETPDGSAPNPVTFSLTPSDRRSDKNGIAQLKRQGVRVPKVD